ncbi:sensor histidine kinase [Pusillimonas caeni]|uniref:sensor histidine kinase n=1 Tax=Pusillimonas caeni TaxID=1348472 RepID=UPI001FD7D33E|nr:HAMP domain-containing sensor histidine kinase [Pusillimonas caeni]
MCAHSLRCRVLVSLLAAFLLGFGVLAYHLFDTRDQLRRGMAYIHAQEMAAGLTMQSDFSRLPLRHAGGELSYTLYDPDGKVLWLSDNLDRPRRLRGGTFAEEASSFRWAMNSGRVISVPVHLADGSTLMVAKEDRLESRMIEDFLHTRVLQGLIVLLPFCLLGLASVLGLLHWTLRPVRQAARLAADIGPHEPGRRIPLDKLPHEIVPLAKAANDGLERLSQAYEYEQHIVADAAHELRTPLTVLSLRLQKCRRDGQADWPAIEGDVSQACKLVNQLLLLARADRGDARAVPDAHRAHLPRVAREAVAGLLPLFEDRGRAVEALIDTEDVWVKGDPDTLREAVRNVLENALFHGRGVVRVHLTHAGNGVAALDVSDEGEGIPLEFQDEMFRRFRKGRQGSAGSGLGLAIVRRVMRNAGGDVRFVSAHPCVVRLSFARD